jgi:lipoprotein-anchoring transpeptidase ErfK/SrfK
MRIRILQLIGTLMIVAGLLIASVGATTRSSQAVKHRRVAAQKHRQPRATATTLPCGDYLGFQVLLDRQGFSPGQLDGQPGTNFSHALAAFQNARQLTGSGQPDCDTWHALNNSNPSDVLTTYVVTEQDLAGPFEPDIPRNIGDQAKLPALSYRSPMELIAERFHASPALLQRLNRGAAFTAGQQIRVPAVTPFDVSAKPASDPASNVTIQVARDDSSLKATRPDGAIVFYAPVTTGSEHDPLPTGDYKVTGVLWMPAFHYNPDLFWDAKATDAKATIKPGPNNPVGVAWISLSLQHYGLHGTPEPGHIGHTESHGCVRLTNWDAARVAALVKPGTPVQFR